MEGWFLPAIAISTRVGDYGAASGVATRKMMERKTGQSEREEICRRCSIYFTELSLEGIDDMFDPAFVAIHIDAQDIES